jgi:hypothetical protein
MSGTGYVQPPVYCHGTGTLAGTGTGIGIGIVTCMPGIQDSITTTVSDGMTPDPLTIHITTDIIITGTLMITVHIEGEPLTIIHLKNEGRTTGQHLTVEGAQT